MIHKNTVDKYDGPLIELAEDLGNLRYDDLRDFLRLLKEKLRKDEYADFQRGRGQLSMCLRNIASAIDQASKHTDEAWEICKPFMEK